MSESDRKTGTVVRRRGGTPSIPIGYRPAPSDDELETNVLERWMGWMFILTLFLGVFLPVYVLFFEKPRMKDAALEQRAESIERGAAHFALSTEENTSGYGCAQCHGANAQGGVVPNFKSAPTSKPVDYPAPNLREVFQRQLDAKKTPTEAYRFVYETIAEGRPGTPMATWGLGYGGPLNDQQIEDIINYLISIQEGIPKGVKLAVGASRGPFSRLIAFGSESR
ncbi:MAG TPA: cytochrome c [Mycobacteriales bacterium]|nr:cytochrome c [Mycobacteriales bacterium]